MAKASSVATIKPEELLFAIADEGDGFLKIIDMASDKAIRIEKKYAAMLASDLIRHAQLSKQS